jgi:hypothetical protein
VIALALCTLEARAGKLYVKDADGVVALRRDSGEWIDAFGGVFTPYEIGSLHAFVRQNRTYKILRAMRVDRIVRKSHGRLTRTEAKNVEERRHNGTDFISWRKPGDFARIFADAKKHADPARVAREVGELRSWTRDVFWHYGPSSSGLWPGDSMVWDPNVPGAPCQSGDGAWVVKRGNG